MVQTDSTAVRLADLISTLSIAIDLGMGQPADCALRTCLLSLRLGEKLGLSQAELKDVYYLALLRHIGCNVRGDLMAAYVGDEIALRKNINTIDYAHPAEMMSLMFRHFRQVNEAASPFQLARTMAKGFWGMAQLMKEESFEVCEVAQRLAQRLGFGETIQQALLQANERWDGRGVPNGIKGENILLLVRIVALAQDVIIFNELGGY